MRKKKFPEQIGSILESYFYKRGWQSKLREYKIWTHWKKIVGEKLFERSIPIKLRDGKLTIAVSNASWLTQLQFMKSDLIKKIDENLEIQLDDIYLVIQPSEPLK